MKCSGELKGTVGHCCRLLLNEGYGTQAEMLKHACRIQNLIYYLDTIILTSVLTTAMFVIIKIERFFRQCIRILKKRKVREDIFRQHNESQGTLKPALKCTQSNIHVVFLRGP